MLTYLENGLNHIFEYTEIDTSDGLRHFDVSHISFKCISVVSEFCDSDHAYLFRPIYALYRIIKGNVINVMSRFYHQGS